MGIIGSYVHQDFSSSGWEHQDTNRSDIRKPCGVMGNPVVRDMMGAASRKAPRYYAETSKPPEFPPHCRQRCCYAAHSCRGRTAAQHPLAYLGRYRPSPALLRRRLLHHAELRPPREARVRVSQYVGQRTCLCPCPDSDHHWCLTHLHWRRAHALHDAYARRLEDVSRLPARRRLLLHQ